MLDLLIVLAFVAYALGAGLVARKASSRNLQEYFLAGGTVPGWKAGFSMAATQFAADTPLLVTGLVATAGISALWRLWVYAFAFLFMAFVFAAGWRRGGVLTDAELTEVRYSGRGVLALRVLKAVYYGTVVNCVVLAMVMVAAVRIAEVFLPWNAWLPVGLYQPVVGLVAALGLDLGSGALLGLPPEVATANNLISILAIMVFTAGYSTTGGLRAVIETDVVQFSLAMVATAVYAWIVVADVGGLPALTGRLVALYGAADAGRMLSFLPSGAGDLLLPFLVVVGLQWLFQMNSDGTGYLAQRSMACRSERDARQAGVLFAWMQILLRSLLWLVIAVGLLVLYPFTPQDAGAEGFAAARELTFVTGVDDLMPPGLRGLMLTGLLAALASTVDTHLNWGASYWSNDLYDRLVCQRWLRRDPGPRELVLVARLSNAVILVLALVVMANLGSIQTAWFVSLLFGAGMGSVLVLRWLWERINLWSELAAMAASLITAPLLLLLLGTDPEGEWLRLAIMAGVTTAAAVGVTFVTPRTDREVLLAFYERVQPFGWWRATARDAGDRPEAPLRLLARRSLSVAACAASLFLLLLGCGRLLVGAPGVSPDWSWGFVLVGLALVPLWWRDLGRRLEVDRSARVGDREIGDADLAARAAASLPGALRHLAEHLKVSQGLAVAVEGAASGRQPAVGQRLLLFQAVEDLLLHFALAGCRRADLGIGREAGLYRIELAPRDGPLDLGAGAGHDLLAHLGERLRQVGGRLGVEPERKAARRIVLAVPLPGGGG
ncbi:Na+/proline symporter [Tistlia consotensis]|uniref:Na+/proline symporter n=1 Tax=Tistlia consotensis USBA 355 TaxID=560819 RepID=A0A1Y6CM12_9PROT|nr:sodium:solute symporter family protein [Tistlia consotensis]SMF73759.1 Na+/proline symporter [Tistlia consotensis USBA 355]SNS28706.1 Na+/proline symporter [Tistlia consotensis]